MRAGRGKVRAALALVVSGLLMAAGSAQSGCGLPEMFGGASLAHSRWDEQDASGRRLLRESGTLVGRRVGMALRCDGWTTQADWERRQGSRAYDGFSSRGMPISTHSDVDEETLSLRLLWQASAAWRLGLRAESRDLHRELASVGTVLGYSERHRHETLGLGAEGEGATAWADWRWQAGLWLGAGGAGRVDVELPDADPLRLRTGVQRFAESELAVLSPERARGWQARFGILLRQERIDAGPTSTLWRNGVPVGVANQPRQNLQDASLLAGLNFRF